MVGRAGHSYCGGGSRVLRQTERRSGRDGGCRDGSTRVKCAFEDWEDPGLGDWNWPRTADAVQCPVPWALKIHRRTAQTSWTGRSAVSASVSVFSCCESARNDIRKRWGAGVRGPALAVVLGKVQILCTASARAPAQPKRPRWLLHGHAPSWPVGRLWHGSFTDRVPYLNYDGSKQAKTERGRVEGAPAKRERQKR